MLRKSVIINCLIATLAISFISGCGAKSAAVTNAVVNPSSPSVDAGSTTAADSTEKGYVFNSSNETMFINWTANGAKIAGQLQITALYNNGVQSANHAFNGIINGSSISLTFIGSVLNDGFSGKVFTGTHDGNNKLTLLLPATDGTMFSAVFNMGTVSDFNNTVKSFNDKYSQAQNAAQQQADSEKQAQQQAASEKKGQEIIADLTQRCNSLKQDSSSLSNYDFSKDIDTMQKHFAKMQDDYAGLQKDASVTPLTYQQLNGVVYQDLNGKMYQDLNGAMYQDLNGAIYQDISNLNNVISNVNTEISSVESGYKVYKANNLSGSSYADSDITNLVSQAEDDVKSGNSTVSSTKKQANDIYSQGDQLYKTAETFFSTLKSSN